MKKIWILAVIAFVCQSSIAQTYDTTTYDGKIGYIFNNLNKSLITTGFLREAGIDFVDLDYYSGQVLTDSNYTTIADWRALYESIYSEQINNLSSIVGLDTVNPVIQSYTSFSLPITIATLYYNYQSLDSSAVANNLISISNNQLNDVPGRSHSPYDSKYVFSIAPTTQIVLTGSNQMIFRSQLFYTNVNKTISTIKVDPYGTGTYQTVTMNTAFNVNYTDTGVYVVNVKITYTDSSTVVGHSKLAVFNAQNNGDAFIPTRKSKYANYGPPEIDHLIEYDAYRYQGPTAIQASKSYLGVIGQADFIVELSINNTSGQIKKPLIVVDGFDPYAQDSYSGNTFPAYYLDDINYDQNSFNSYVTIPLNGTSGLDNADSLDLIYLHWHNGTDYIERNAYILEALIHYVDSVKAAAGSTEPNIVLGFSMGGLVARYALRDMEINGINHETSLFISHDAPYWGANVPVGYQIMAQNLGSWKIITGFFNGGNRPVNFRQMVPQLVGLDTLFSTPAAKEMLIQRYILSTSAPYGFNDVTYSISADNSTHTNFLTELSTMGWPVNCRNVTLANGACNGIPVFTGNNVQLMNISGPYSFRSFIGSVIYGFLGTWAGVGIISAVGSDWTIEPNPNALLWSFLSSGFTTSASLLVDINACSIPNSGTGNIYTNAVYVHRSLFFGLFTVNNYIVNCNISSNSAMLPLDNAPGGEYNLEQFNFSLQLIQDELDSAGVSFLKASLPQPSFCFVPTVSSLAINNPSTYLDSSFCATVNCMNPSSVYDYYAPSVNQLHVSYTTDNSNWILKEVQANYTCQKVCPTNLSISGDSVFCTISHQYSISGLPSNTSLTWSATPSSIVHIYNPNDDTTTLSRDTLSDAIDLQASIGNACGTNPTIVVSKDVKVGAPQYYSGTSLFTTSGVNNEILQSCSDLTELSNEFWIGYVSTFDSVATSYSWSLVGETPGADAILTNDPNAQYVEIQIKPGGDYAQYKLDISNACGSYTPVYTFNANTSCNIMIRENATDFSVTPNPATTSVTISTIPAQNNAENAMNSTNTSISGINEKSANTPTTIQRVIVYGVDGRSAIDLTLNSPQQTISVSTAGLPNGVYFIHIVDNNKMVKIKKLVIER